MKDCKPLQYLLTLPPMEIIVGTCENKDEFKALGDKGLYSLKFYGKRIFSRDRLTIKELIEILPAEKYFFKIKFQDFDQSDLLKELDLLYEMNKKRDFSNKIEKLEKEIVWNTITAYSHALKHEKRFLLLEPAIAKSAKYSFLYSVKILGERFPLGEPTIAKNAEYAYEYIMKFTHNRWPEAERSIAESPEYAYKYSRNILHERWPEGEKGIMKDSKWIYCYAFEFIKGSWPEAEPFLTDKMYKNLYDQNVAPLEKQKFFKIHKAF